MSNPTETNKDREAKEEPAKKPGRDDVHEQREQDQPREGVVEHKHRHTVEDPNPPRHDVSR